MTVAIWILAALCVVGFAQAMLLFPRLMNRGEDGVSPGDLPDPTQREVLAFISNGETPLVLKPTRDLVEAAVLDGRLLDRALFLFERGREVSVGTFCDRAVTPRDLAIVAP